LSLVIALFLLFLWSQQPGLASVPIMLHLGGTSPGTDEGARTIQIPSPYLDSGQMVVFGPILDGTGSWGLGVVEADDEQELRSFAGNDPVVTTGTGKIEIGSMLGGWPRGQ
jgi:YCII-related domain